jgi:hypothetical protein
MQPVGECVGLPAGNLYRETTSNSTFPYRNLTAGGLDVDGDGKVDIKYKSSAFDITAPVWVALSLATVAALW